MPLFRVTLGAWYLVAVSARSGGVELPCAEAETTDRTAEAAEQSFLQTYIKLEPHEEAEMQYKEQLIPADLQQEVQKLERLSAELLQRPAQQPAQQQHGQLSFSEFCSRLTQHFRQALSGSHLDRMVLGAEADKTGSRIWALLAIGASVCCFVTYVVVLILSQAWRAVKDHHLYSRGKYRRKGRSIDDWLTLTLEPQRFPGTLAQEKQEMGS
eukprot:TRINITY_DN94825_c0_g1_i1.p1 TRINITY_DN94825_c0_g1~~TRINITY_DN94825_c0_g1_i1.p1  ORF type:complete len:239 (+),score=50.33 TRINITY_DN94825_c0_g1_i1:83-718(+)